MPCPLNVVTGLRAQNSSNGNGIHVSRGSALQLRNSQTQGNKDAGVLVQTYVNGTTKSDDMSKIDLGTSVSAGGNTFQYATGNGPNGGAGICLELTATAAQTLRPSSRPSAPPRPRAPAAWPAGPRRPRAQRTRGTSSGPPGGPGTSARTADVDTPFASAVARGPTT